jgi:hypothetical protein
VNQPSNVWPALEAEGKETGDDALPVNTIGSSPFPMINVTENESSASGISAQWAYSVMSDSGAKMCPAPPTLIPPEAEVNQPSNVWPDLEAEGRVTGDDELPVNTNGS